jgi:hypothetical protein
MTLIFSAVNFREADNSWRLMALSIELTMRSYAWTTRENSN